MKDNIHYQSWSKWKSCKESTHITTNITFCSEVVNNTRTYCSCSLSVLLFLKITVISICKIFFFIKVIIIELYAIFLDGEFDNSYAYHNIVILRVCIFTMMFVLFIKWLCSFCIFYGDSFLVCCDVDVKTENINEYIVEIQTKKLNFYLQPDKIDQTYL